MKIKSFIEKQHINLIYGLNLFLFVTLFDRYSFIFSGIGNNYSVSKNELIILELLFLFINFVVLFCLYRVSTAIYVILTTITTKPIYLAYKLKLII